MKKRKTRSSKNSPSRNEPCPCGSGKKYKRCCALKEGGTVQGSAKILIWIGGVALAVLLGYAVTQMGTGSGTGPSLTSSRGLQRTGYYTDRDLREVDFSALTGEQKQEVLDHANEARCTCGCGLSLAQCVATDSTCPLRNSNIERIRSLVQQESGGFSRCRKKLGMIRARFHRK